MQPLPAGIMGWKQSSETVQALTAAAAPPPAAAVLTAVPAGAGETDPQGSNGTAVDFLWSRIPGPRDKLHLRTGMQSGPPTSGMEAEGHRLGTRDLMGEQRWTQPPRWDTQGPP